MSTPDAPAVARRRVRLALRQARLDKGLTQNDVAEAMEWSLSKIQRIEKGEVSIAPADLRVLLTYLGVTDRAEIDQLAQDARASRRERWTVDQQVREHLTPASLELTQLELDATAIRYYASIVVPGPLQTPEYARAVLRGYAEDLDPATIDVRIEQRLSRRERLFRRPGKPQFLTILDASVLYRDFCGRAALAEQLTELVALQRRMPNVIIRVMPFDAPVAVLLVGPFSVLDLSGPQDAVLYRERHSNDEIVQQKREIGWHRDTFERLWREARSEEESAEMIMERVRALNDQQ